MGKQEFIDRLRAALNGRISTAQVTDTINYYDDYINTEIRKGRTEEEVLMSLGDPRLIAKTIVQTSGGDTAQSAEYRDAYQNENEQNGSYSQSGYRNGYQNSVYGSENNRYRGIRSTRVPSWLLTVIAVIVVLLVGAAVFSALSFLAPLLIVMAAVIFMVKLFRDWLN